MVTRHRRHARGSGAAFVEALVAAPVLALILAGVLALHAMYSAKLEAKARARRLAWVQADSGKCASRACSGAGCRGIEDEIRANAIERVQLVGSSGFSLRSFLGSLGGFLLGETTDGIGSATAPMPGLASSAQTVKQGVTRLLCNTTPRATGSSDSILEHACSTDLRMTEYAREVCE